MPRLFQKTTHPGERAVLESRIRNHHGLHPRLACDLVRCANRFQSHLAIHMGRQKFSARRVTDLLQANLQEGALFTIVAEGPDAPLAAAALDSFLRHLAVVEDHSEPEHRRRALRRHDGLSD